MSGRGWRYGRRSGSKLRAAIELFGASNFTFEIVGEFPDEKMARTAESANIIKYQTGWPDGLNVKGSGRRTSYVVNGVSDPICQFRKAQISLWDSERKKRIDAERALRKVLGMTEFDIRSVNGKLKNIDAAYIEKQRMGATGRKQSAETCEKKRLVAMAMWKNPQTVEKMKHRKHGVMSATTLAELARKNRAHWADPKNKRALSEKMKAAWSGPAGEIRKQKLRDRHAHARLLRQPQGNA